ncbi:MAG: DUF1425 domain-containing protein [Phycisphaeraceae bacterium]
MIRLTLCFVFAGALASCLTACESAPPAGRPDATTWWDYPLVTVIEDLRDDIRYGEAVVTRGEDRPMTVVVPLRSLDDEDYVSVRYKFQFFDEARRPVEPQMSWRVIQLEPQAQEFVTGQATDTTAVDWRLVIRRAK